jgi:hypothetical protein
MNGDLQMLTMQTIKKNWVYILFALAVVFFVYKKLIKKTNDKDNKHGITVKTIHTALGWGYDIYKNDTLFIHQEMIPAAAGNKGFANEEEALTIGKLAASKMKTMQFPTITAAELDSCKITR